MEKSSQYPKAFDSALLTHAFDTIKFISDKNDAQCDVTEILLASLWARHQESKKIKGRARNQHTDNLDGKNNCAICNRSRAGKEPKLDSGGVDKTLMKSNSKINLSDSFASKRERGFGECLPSALKGKTDSVKTRQVYIAGAEDRAINVKKGEDSCNQSENSRKLYEPRKDKDEDHNQSDDDVMIIENDVVTINLIEDVLEGDRSQQVVKQKEVDSAQSDSNGSKALEEVGFTITENLVDEEEEFRGKEMELECEATEEVFDNNQCEEVSDPDPVGNESFLKITNISGRMSVEGLDGKRSVEEGDVVVELDEDNDDMGTKSTLKGSSNSEKSDNESKSTKKNRKSLAKEKADKQQVKESTPEAENSLQPVMMCSNVFNRQKSWDVEISTRSPYSVGEPIFTSAGQSVATHHQEHHHQQQQHQQQQHQHKQYGMGFQHQRIPTSSLQSHQEPFQYMQNAQQHNPPGYPAGHPSYPPSQEPSPVEGPSMPPPRAVVPTPYLQQQHNEQQMQLGEVLQLLPKEFLQVLVGNAQSQFIVNGKVDCAKLHTVVSQIVEVHPYLDDKQMALHMYLLGGNFSVLTNYKIWLDQNKRSHHPSLWPISDPSSIPASSYNTFVVDSECDQTPARYSNELHPKAQESYPSSYMSFHNTSSQPGPHNQAGMSDTPVVYKSGFQGAGSKRGKRSSSSPASKRGRSVSPACSGKNTPINIGAKKLSAQNKKKQGINLNEAKRQNLTHLVKNSSKTNLRGGCTGRGHGRGRGRGKGRGRGATQSKQLNAKLAEIAAKQKENILKRGKGRGLGRGRGLSRGRGLGRGMGRGQGLLGRGRGLAKGQGSVISRGRGRGVDRAGNSTVSRSRGVKRGQRGARGVGQQRGRGAANTSRSPQTSRETDWLLTHSSDLFIATPEREAKVKAEAKMILLNYEDFQE